MHRPMVFDIFVVRRICADRRAHRINVIKFWQDVREHKYIKQIITKTYISVDFFPILLYHQIKEHYGGIQNDIRKNRLF